MTRPGLVLAVLALFAVAVAGQGQGSPGTGGPPNQPPEPGEPRPFSPPAVSREALPNGMAIRLAPYGAVPKVSVRLVIQTGNVDESASQIWLADLMGELMQQGTASRSAQDVAVAAARMGGSLGIGVGINQMTIGGDVLSEFGEEMVSLVGEVALRPALPAAELPRLKKDMLRNLAMARSQPRQLALEAFTALLYPRHAYGRLFPTAEMIQDYTIEDVRTFYARNLGARRASIYVVGRFDAAGVQRAIRTVFGGWAPGPAPTVPDVAPHSTNAIHLVDRPGAVQSTIYLGQPVVAPTDPDYLPLIVTNALLGGYFSSRITSNLREDKGYSYSPFSSVAPRLGTAYFAQVADVATAVTGPALKEILFEIERLREEPPTPEELDAVQNYLSGTFVLQNSSRGGIVSQLAYIDLHDLPDGYLERYVQRVNALTPADIQRMARMYLQDDRMTIVIVGDRAAILDQVRPYGEVVE
jgi:zinc protease